MQSLLSQGLNLNGDLPRAIFRGVGQQTSNALFCLQQRNMVHSQKNHIRTHPGGHTRETPNNLINGSSWERYFKHHSLIYAEILSFPVTARLFHTTGCEQQPSAAQHERAPQKSRPRLLRS